MQTSNHVAANVMMVNLCGLSFYMVALLVVLSMVPFVLSSMVALLARRLIFGDPLAKPCVVDITIGVNKTSSTHNSLAINMLI